MIDRVLPVEVAGPVLVVSPFAADRLLRLKDALRRQRAAESMLHGTALMDLRPLLARTIFSLYLDCWEAGAGDDAVRLIAAERSGPGFATPEPADAAPEAAGGMDADLAIPAGSAS
jgi:hypothetical protein